MAGSTQTELPFAATRGTPMQAAPIRGATGGKPGNRQAGNRGPWLGVLQGKGAEQEGRLLAARKMSQSYIRRSKIPPKTPPKAPPKTPTGREAAQRDLLACVAMADVSPAVREALASFGRAIEAGFLARQQRSQMPRHAWWNRD